MNAHRLIPNRQPIFLRKDRSVRGPVSHATPRGMKFGSVPAIDHTRGQPAVISKCACGRELIGAARWCSACDPRMGVVIRPSVGVVA